MTWKIFQHYNVTLVKVFTLVCFLNSTYIFYHGCIFKQWLSDCTLFTCLNCKWLVLVESPESFVLAYYSISVNASVSCNMIYSNQRLFWQVCTACLTLFLDHIYKINNLYVKMCNLVNWICMQFCSYEIKANNFASNI